MQSYFFIVFILWMGVACTQPANESKQTAISPVNMLSSFHQLRTTPDKVIYQNDLPINNEGGHIQGIQSYMYNKDEFVIVSGSSGTESYYAIIKTGETNEVLSVNSILQKPFKHAGGFQVHQHLMAVGVEDNEARNISKVYIYELGNPLTPPQQPRKIIERTGDYERATAGCVGIATYREQMLVMVGDWNTRHLDVYTCPLQVWEHDSIRFEQVASITTSEMPKEDWIDTHWLSYQNINLINWQDTLYLVGLGVNDEDQDIADLFRIEETRLTDFHLKKIASQKFEKPNGTSFRWGAGVVWDAEKGITRILSSTAHINATSLFNEYRSQPIQ